MTKAVIFQYNEYSNGAKNLANELKKGGQNSLHTLRSTGNGLRLAATIYPDYTINEPHVCICWGNRNLSHVQTPNRLFFNAAIKTPFIRKDSFFKEFSDGANNLRLPKVAFNHAQAVELLREMRGLRGDDKPLLVERHELSSHSGNGIRIVKGTDDLSAGLRLYVQYIPKAEEYRVHFFRPTNSYWVQQKRLKREATETDTRYTIRNHLNGWVYCTEDLNVPEDVYTQAKNFVGHHKNNLDFGAIDIIYNERHNKAFVLEVNTAPGLEGKTVTWYAKNIKDAVKAHDFTQPTSAYTPLNIEVI